MPRAIGQVTTSSSSKVAIASTTYTEQAALSAACSLQSSNANDAAAGTGARTVKITYYSISASGVITGPFVETVPLNGATSVPTVGTNISLIEKMEVIAVGSGLVAAGTISLYNATGGSGGAGSVFCSIASGQVRTFLGVHYVPSNMQCDVTDIETLGGDTTVAQVEVMKTPYPLAVEQSTKGPIGCTATMPRAVPFPESFKSVTPGPARLRLVVTPGSGTSQTTVASFGYVDRLSGAF